MSNHEILCIKKSNRQSAHEKIKFIGGTNADRTRLKLSQQKSIESVESGKWRFWVSVNGKSIGVIVSTSAVGNKYLKTR